MEEEIIKYSLKNLWQKRSRSFFTILSIFMGITAIFVFISFGLGLYQYVGEFTSGSSADKITIQPKGAGAPGLDDTFALTVDDLEAVEDSSGVYEVSGVYFKAAEIKQKGVNRFVWLIAYDPKNDLIVEQFGVDISHGRDLQRSDEGKVVLGYNYQFDDKIIPGGLELNDQIEVQGKDLRVIGFYESIGNPQDDSNIYVTEDELDDLYPNETLNYGWIIARVDVSDIDPTIERVEKNVRRSRGLEEGKEDFFVASFQDLLESYSNAIFIIIAFVVLIALISVIVSAINTANTMITSVLERIKEIGVIKSIGATNSEVFNIFLLESGFLGLAAGVLGVLVGGGITYIGGKALEASGWGFLQPYYSFWLFFGIILFAVITGAVSGVVPAYRASKLKPVDALRYE